MEKLRSIQVLRALAVLGVVIYHATFTRFGVGAAGVDLFFVISGFIMAKVSDGRESGAFFADRLWRIVPLYILALAVQVALFPIEPTYCRTMASLTLWPAWPDWCFPYVVQAWTLSYELLFYALVALFIRRRHWLFVALPALVAWRLFAPTPPFLWVGNPLILEFLAGFALASIPRRFGAITLFAGILWISQAPAETKSLLRAVYWGIPAVLIVHGALSLEDAFRRRWANILVALGDASYSIYLAHVIILRLLDLGLVGDVAAVSLLGYGVHKYVEKPLLGLRRGQRIPMPTPASPSPCIGNTSALKRS